MKEQETKIDINKFLVELSEVCNKHCVFPDTNGFFRDVVLRCMEPGKESVEFYIDHNDRLRENVKQL